MTGSDGALNFILMRCRIRPSPFVLAASDGEYRPATEETEMFSAMRKPEPKSAGYAAGDGVRTGGFGANASMSYSAFDA
ncbi:hypothetical protein QN219_07005 [Sinorhizobium sp. 7-81]|uniref:hypothetical protein n=1 Tax=Sinorhizobium sp. 8-89 TaxID=3049089 RepID=UPI0024C3DFD1|nr:hypothetical protein [Sinorhizobium sp. 8-89]MDK1489803.1 hypothetical protein [Sinorhizobium sp. 8-89]